MQAASASSSQTTTVAITNDSDELYTLDSTSQQHHELIHPASVNIELTSGLNPKQPSQLSSRKRSNQLNHSLNETDLVKKRTAGLCSDAVAAMEECESEDNNEEVASSLHKSKRSIRNIEQTVKSSKSIEQWLDKAAAANNDETISFRRQQMKQTAKEVLNATRSDLNVDLKTNLKLATAVKRLVELNTSVADLAEGQLADTVNKFIVPSNSEDKPLLKWLITDRNLDVSLCRPCLSEQMQRFILTPANLNVSTGDETETEDSMDDQTYLRFSPATGRLSLQVAKIEHVLTREKQLCEQQSLSNSKSKEQLAEFRAKYVENANFVGAQCLLSFAKRKNSSSSLKSSPITDLMSVDLGYAELGEKLFACFLSNYSCELSEYFLDSVDSIDTFGFVRKHYTQHQLVDDGTDSGGCVSASTGDKSFSFVTMENELAVSERSTNGTSSNNSSMSGGCLRVSNVRFGFRLDRWPVAAGFDFVQRLSVGSGLAKKVVNALDLTACLLVTGN
jgi:hypothetical protein